VEIEKAVGEICRVVKSGGRIAFIDKNAEQWGKLETPEWEKWFTRRELERLLRKHCREVSSRPMWSPILLGRCQARRTDLFARTTLWLAGEVTIELYDPSPKDRRREQCRGAALPGSRLQ
jgi:SAM-dependent methyltransferase